MDLGTIQSKIESGKYSVEKFAADMRLVWKNAMTYNRQDSEIYKTAEDLADIFEKKFSKVKKPKRKSEGKLADGSERKTQTAPSPEQIKFTQLVNQLDCDQLGHIVDMVHRQCPSALSKEADEIIELEVSALDNNILQQLLAYVNTCVSSDPTSKTKKKSTA